MSEQSLRTYYNYLYPFHTLVNWLTQNGRSQLAHRQLSFQYEGVGVQRYVVFNAEKMKERMIDDRAKIPLKVDAGAIWDRVPQKQSSGKTIERELIFDFDMNDYDDVRTCCSGKKVCVLCWKLLIIAVEVIEEALKEDFNFHKLMFVFSGGRGLHIWVCDKEARELKDTVRKAIVDYLELVTGNEKATSLLADRVVAKVDDNKLWKGKVNDRASRDEVMSFYMANYTSAHVQRSLKILAKYFFQVMEEQKVFEHEKCVERMLRIIAVRSEKLKERVIERWEKAKAKGLSVMEMFKQMCAQIVTFQMAISPQDYAAGRQSDGKVHRLTFIEQEIMLSFLYPRMDYNVSTMQNHLLKLPFSVHPKSRKISIPLLKRQVRGFNPDNCVSIDQVLKELDYTKLADRNEENARLSLLWEPIKTLEQFAATLD